MKVPALLLSHAAVAALGWAFVITTFPSAPKDKLELPTKVARSREATSPARDLLSHMEADLPASARATTEAQKRAATQQAAEERLKNLTLPTDFAAAFEKILKKKDWPEEEAELSALYLAWCRKDPTAAMIFLREHGLYDVPPFTAIDEMLGYEADPAAILAQHDQPVPYTAAFIDGLVRKIIETRSLDELKHLIQETGKTSIPELSYALAAQWPAEHSMELVELAHSMKMAKWLDVHARSLGQNEGVLFLHSLLSLDLRPTFIRSVLSGEIPNSFIASAEGVPPGIRAEVLRQMGDVDPESPDEEIEGFLDDLPHRDVSAFLFPVDQPEPAQEFKTGDTDALSLLRKYQQQFPGYHDEQTLRLELFKNLAPIDPARAVVLLDFLNEADRRAEVESLLKTAIVSHPDQTHQLLSLVPPPRDQEELRARYDYWWRSANHFRTQYKTDYQYWVEHLPSGVDRDLALAVLANRMEEKQPQEAAQLRGQITRLEIRSLR